MGKPLLGKRHTVSRQGSSYTSYTWSMSVPAELEYYLWFISVLAELESYIRFVSIPAERARGNTWRYSGRKISTTDVRHQYSDFRSLWSENGSTPRFTTVKLQNLKDRERISLFRKQNVLSFKKKKLTKLRNLLCHKWLLQREEG